MKSEYVNFKEVNEQLINNIENIKNGITFTTKIDDIEMYIFSSKSTDGFYLIDAKLTTKPEKVFTCEIPYSLSFIRYYSLYNSYDVIAEYKINK